MHAHGKGENRVERANVTIIEIGSGSKQKPPTKGINTPLESFRKASMGKERNITDHFCKNSDMFTDLSFTAERGRLVKN